MNKIKLIIALVLLSSIVIISFLVFDYYQNEDNLDQIEITQANSIITTINLDFQHTLESNLQLEDFIINELNTAAALADHINNTGNPSLKQIKSIADEFEITNIEYLDNHGNLQISSADSIHSKSPSNELLNYINYLKDTNVSYLDLGTMVNPYTNNTMYLLLRKRTQSKGFILIGIKNRNLIELRRSFGIGAKIAEFLKNSDIKYIILQDKNGIYAASDNYLETPSIQSDPFLLHSFSNKSMDTRFSQYRGQKVLEIIKPFSINDDEILTRIGFSLAQIEEVRQSSSERILFAAILTFVILIVLMSYILTRKKLTTLNIEHSKIKAHLNFILSNIADGVIALDSEMRIIVFNDAVAKTLNISQNVALNQDYFNLFNIDLFNVKEALTTKKSILLEKVKYITTDSIERFLSSTTNIIFNENSLETIIILIKDITEQLKVQKQLEVKEQQSVIGELASGIAHEIRNPLNAINIIIQRFQMEFEVKTNDEEFQRMLRILKNEIQRINNIIEQFLSFARPPKLNFQRVNLNEIVDEIIFLMENQAKQYKINIYKNYEQYTFLEIDANKIKQVLINLIQNSIEAMPDGGDIVISTQQTLEQTIIKITDSGKGIPEDKKNKIFSLYYTTKKNGNGLGLAIVHQIVSEHNGEIVCNSSINKGTTFEITLPNSHNLS
jgi:signal transduction histidine kinase